MRLLALKTAATQHYALDVVATMYGDVHSNIPILGVSEMFI